MFENIRLAFQGIWSHKMRSFLTMLGIIIGIASIIAIVSTIKGTSEQIKDNLIGSGNNTVNVTLSQGDSAYSVDYYDGSSSGSTPILSQSLKDEVLKQTMWRMQHFFSAEQTTTAVFTMRTAVFPVVRSMALIPII